ncbi:hypothetical protein A6U87_24400 [Rhizobium sp. AC44/96]|uniref:hypothetical protein n=1 Tax=Rhizobium sp. AC44/96 TaxID=1841654 RepID=UPI00080FAFD1|nr:hypothetical protein [Rhizobium sp. AC44/96]OCJ15268.1 hypothetical protein A6U87_24400 [Rhizobium sp. AC44/96]
MEFSSALLGAVVGALATAFLYSVADKWEEKASMTREVSYRQACVKEYQSGWSFDRCQRQANREAATADTAITVCLAALEKQNATIAEIDKACPDDERAALQ